VTFIGNGVTLGVQPTVGVAKPANTLDLTIRLDSPLSIHAVDSAAALTETAIESGRQDLNLRPLRPERSALAKLSYSPIKQ
jgi:hypothetical protein